MEWYNYLAAFFSGMFLCNAIPHFIHGISGDKFPTPFAKPPGKGLSPPYINVWWAAFNISVGYLLYEKSNVSPTNLVSLIIFFIGAITIALMLSKAFTEKHKD